MRRGGGSTVAAFSLPSGTAAGSFVVLCLAAASLCMVAADPTGTEMQAAAEDAEQQLLGSNPGSLVRESLVPSFFSELDLDHDEGSRQAADCLASRISEEVLITNLTRVSDLLSGRLGHDPLLAMRSALRKLSASLELLAGSDTEDDCGLLNVQSWKGLRKPIRQLAELVQTGRLNDGHCPFKRIRQTTIGGAEVGNQLRRLGKADWTARNRTKVRKAAKQIGKILRKVQDDGDDPDPAGTFPVNWEMRNLMFGKKGTDEL
eukprot:TRINITY_DN69112_c0_g1_i1.p1 TRINITY_DN69112_c0_g1~~TRINITY_DN69112_c0_g1_i1.p1  ORF type:complete len:261 (+),score=50.84 TRINITY_DN69112_c0_g1_i1:119-901(+)